MPIELKALAGILNTDDNNEVMPAGHHKMAKNIVFRGNGNNLRPENVKGNVKISNSAFPEGENECIGSFYDGIRQRIIWFNWNSDSKHGIYSYSLQSKTISQLLVCFTHSTTDILGFDREYPIASVNIIYATEDIGDTLVWVARNNRPMKLNLTDAEGGEYGADWLEEYLTVARPMPLISPFCEYKDDATVAINNLRKKLYEFRYRWAYKDFTKSTWSPYSKLFAPANPDDVADDIDEQKNNRIDVYVDTGASDVVKMEVAARQTLSTGFSDNFLIATIDKEDLSLVDNQQYVYQFFNDSAYPYIDVEESNLLFDYVPKTANTQELLNGNVIIYGGVTEGYDFEETLDVDVTVSSVEYVAQLGALKITLLQEDKFQYDDGGTTYWSYYAPFDIGGTPEAGDVYTMEFNCSAFGGSFTISYTALLGDTALDVATALSNAFMALTQTPVNQYECIYSTSSIFPSGQGIIVQNYPTVNTELEMSYVSTTYSYANAGAPVDGVSNSIYKQKSRYGFGLVYFDDFGVTPGVKTTPNMLILTPEVTTTGDTTTEIPKIDFEINHQPPVWATKFAFVRTRNISVQELLSTVSADTKKDSGGSPNYAYINIKNQQDNQNNFPSYRFTAGDRVRILGKYGDAIGTVYDFPIVSYKIDPTINAATETGDFLVIPYDAVLSNFGTAGYEHYSIEIYTPALNADTTQQSYFEFGESYLVLNPGTDNRYHQGQLQDQTDSLPATYSFLRGDFYIKKRKIPFAADLSSVTEVWIVDQSVSDLFPSKVVGNGRVFVVDEYAKENYFPTTVRWSLAYQQNTSINQTNRFYPLNFDEIDRQKGDIQRLKTRDRILRVFQNRGCGQYGVYAKFIQNNAGESQLVTTNDIITANNINYYEGEYGLGDQYTSLVSGKNQDYFVDPIRGYQVRLSNDGLTPISELYKGQFYIRNLLTPYGKDLIGASGTKARILGCYDFFEEEYVCVLKGYNTLNVGLTPNYIGGLSVKKYMLFSFSGDVVDGFTITIELSGAAGAPEQYSYQIQAGDTIEDIVDALVAAIDVSTKYDANKTSASSFSVETIIAPTVKKVSAVVSWSYDGSGLLNANTFSFNEKRNAYSSFFDIYPEWIICAEDVLYSWVDGDLWVHNDDVNYCKFFGTQYYPNIKLVFNDKTAIKKVFNAISYQGNQVWVSDTNGDVNTSMINPQTGLQQISQLKSVDYEIQENIRYAALLRDANSGSDAAVALLEGDVLNGQWIEVNLIYKGSEYAWLYSPYVQSQVSNRNF